MMKNSCRIISLTCVAHHNNSLFENRYFLASPKNFLSAPSRYVIFKGRCSHYRWGLPVSSNPKKRVKQRSMRYSVVFTLAKIHPIVYIAKHFARRFCKAIPSRSLCPVSGTAGQCATGLCRWSNLLLAPARTSATWANTPSACVNHLCRVTNTLYTCVNTFCHPGKHSRHACKSPLSPCHTSLSRV